jgi:hypothetical protein
VTVTATPVESLSIQDVSWLQIVCEARLTLLLAEVARRLALSAGSNHHPVQQRRHAFAFAQSVRSHRPSVSHHLMDVAAKRMTVREMVLAALLCYAGERWSCSEDDMKTTLAGKEQQLPDRRLIVNEGRLRSVGRVASRSFTQTAEASQPRCRNVRKHTHRRRRRNFN